MTENARPPCLRGAESREADAEVGGITRAGSSTRRKAFALQRLSAIDEGSIVGRRVATRLPRMRAFPDQKPLVLQV